MDARETIVAHLMPVVAVAHVTLTARSQRLGEANVPSWLRIVSKFLPPAKSRDCAFIDH
ncbi:MULTISPECIES: hypothetical protein [unclassified Bradyrhizobium]